MRAPSRQPGAGTFRAGPDFNVSESIVVRNLLGAVPGRGGAEVPRYERFWLPSLLGRSIRSVVPALPLSCSSGWLSRRRRGRHHEPVRRQPRYVLQLHRNKRDLLDVILERTIDGLVSPRPAPAMCPHWSTGTPCRRVRGVPPRRAGIMWLTTPRSPFVAFVAPGLRRGGVPNDLPRLLVELGAPPPRCCRPVGAAGGPRGRGRADRRPSGGELPGMMAVMPMKDGCHGRAVRCPRGSRARSPTCCSAGNSVPE